MAYIYIYMLCCCIMYKVYMWHWNNLFADKFAIDSERGIIYVNGDLNTEGGDVSFTLTVSAENDEATGANPDTVSGPCYLTLTSQVIFFICIPTLITLHPDNCTNYSHW